MLRIWGFDFSYRHDDRGGLSFLEYRAAALPAPDGTIRRNWNEEIYNKLEGLMDDMFLRKSATDAIGRIDVRCGKRHAEVCERPTERVARLLYSGWTPGDANREDQVEVDMTISLATGSADPALGVRLVATGPTRFQNILLAQITVMPGVSWTEEAADRLRRLHIVVKRGPATPGATGFFALP